MARKNKPRSLLFLKINPTVYSVTMKIIDETIYRGLENMRETYPTTRAMAAALGLTSPHVSLLLKREVSHFKSDTWKRIKPQLLPFIEEELNKNACKSCPRVENCLFKVIVKNLLEVPEERQAELYEDVNEYILKRMRKHNKAKIKRE